jgi:transposase
MIYVGIDVAKEKHDCYIVDSEGTVLEDVFTFENSRNGFLQLLSKLSEHSPKNIKIGLESTGHYSNNLISFLSESGFSLTLFNPLHTNLFRKAQTLRKTKTDKGDAKLITTMLFSGDPKPYTPVSYYFDELKSLTRHRYRLVGYRSKLRISVNRLLDIIFPEFSSMVWSIHQNSSYSLLLEFPNPKSIASVHLTKLTNLLNKSSRGKYGKDKALQIKTLAESSIGSNSPSIAFELQQTIRLIKNVQVEIDLLDRKIKGLMDEINSPILTIPGISYILGAIILSETVDIYRFDTPAKYLAYAGLDPSTHQSGKYTAKAASMVKRGSTYLRWALITAARLVSMRDPVFKEYLAKKRQEGKPFQIAISHVAKKLSRVIFYLLYKNKSFVTQAA